MIRPNSLEELLEDLGSVPSGSVKEREPGLYTGGLPKKKHMCFIGEFD